MFHQKSVLFTICALASADILIKLTAGKISNSLALLCYGTCTFLAGLGWVLYEFVQKEKFFAQPIGIVTAIGVGIAFASVTFGLYMTYAKAPISIASPTIRIGAIVLVSIYGILVLQERASIQFLIGIVLAISGIVLMVVDSIRLS